MKTNFTLLVIGFILLGLTQVFSQAVDMTFRSGLEADDIVYTMDVLEDGKIIVGGTINASNTDTSKPRNIARLNADGSRDDTFDAGSGFNNLVRKIAVQDDGKILVGGSFTQYNGKPVNKLARLNADGTLDETFPSNLSFINSRWYEVSEIQVTESEDVFIGGTGNWQSTSSMLKKLDSNGIEDITFKPPTTLYASIYAIEIDKNNKILVGGEISTFSNNNQNLGVIRINQDGSIDSTFTISTADYKVNSIKSDENDRVYVGGQFEEYNGQSFSHIVRLDASGNIDNTFQVESGFFGGTGTGFISGPLGQVRDIDFDGEGRIVVSGSFIRYKEQPVYGIARLNPNGSLESSFTGCGEYQPAATQIFQSEILPDGRVISGGWITKYDGIPGINGVVKLTGDVSSNPSPIVDFDVIIVGRKASFVNNSQHAFEYEWNFGRWGVRANSSTNPVHIFNSPGRYSVSLTGKGFCEQEVTVSKEVSVFGVSNIHPKKGGNVGYVTMTLSGYGFTDQTQVKLVKGSQQISGSTSFVSEQSDELQVYFDLTGKELGEWSLDVRNGGLRLDAKETFEIENVIAPEIHAEFVGRNQIRAGRAERLTVRYSNTGNVDALMVPLTLKFPSTVTVELLDSTKLIDNFAEIIGIQEYKEDTVALTVTYGGDSYLPLFIPIVPANGFGEIEFIVVGLEADEFDISIYSNSSIVDFNNSGSRVLFQTDCTEAFIDMSLATLGTSLSFAGLIPFSDCLSNYGLFLSNSGLAVAQFQRSRKGVGDKVLSSVTILVGLLSLVECTPLSAFPLGKLIGKGAGLISMGISIYGSEIAEADYRSCVVPMRILDEVKMRVVAAFDPNEKVGPTNITEDNYTQGRAPFTYTVFFENVDSATAAAQEVIILDTLNTQLLDLSTFMLTGYGYGNERYKVPTGLSAYSKSYPLLRTVGDAMNVRFDGFLNPETGVVKWRFLSVNPATGELIDDPIDGFLPPNKNPGEGEGYVTFSIMPKQDLPTGTRIENKALIYFDFNEPIVTNTFVNAIDKDSPESRVTALQPVSEDTVFTVSWSGEDTHAGIRSYDVLVSVNEGPYGIWQYDVSHTSAEFTGHADSLYRFYSIAKDHAGNREADKAVFEAETKVVIQSFTIEGVETTAPTCTGEDSGTAVVNVVSTNVILEFSLNNTTFQDSNSFTGLAPGTYKVYVRDKSDTDNTLDAEFTISEAPNESPPIPVVSINGSPGISEELSLLSSSATGNQWFKDGEEIPGANGQSLLITEAGTYHVKVTGIGGCSATSELTAITSTPEVRTMRIKLFPNPAKQRTNIHFDKEAYIDRVRIFSITGVLLQETDEKMSVTTIELDLTGLSAGTYVILVEGQGIAERLRLIKN